MTWVSDSIESPMPVYYWAKLIGLAPFTVRNNRVHPPTLLGKLYPLSLAAAYLSVIAILMPPETVDVKTLPEEPELLSFLLTSQHYLRFLTAFFTLITFALSYEKIQSLLNDLCSISEELKTLGVEEDHGKTFKKILVTAATKNAVVVTLGSIAFVLGFCWQYATRIEYVVGHVFNINILLIYAQVLTCIKKRFALLNKRLLNVLEPAHNVASHSDSDSRDAGQTLTSLQKIRKIEALHLELCKLVDRTTSLFKIPILVNAYDLFDTLTLFFHLVFDVAVILSSSCGAERDVGAEMSLIIPPSAARAVLLLVEALIIVDASSTTCQEGKATEAVLFQVWNKFEPMELKDEFAMFSVQMMHKSARISVWGIFDVDYSLIHKIIGTAVAYVFVLIQLTEPQACP